MEGLNETVWTARDLLERLERCERFFVLDVRNRDEFERFRIEGREPLPAVNVPYFEMLELGGKDEMVDSVVAYIEQHMANQLLPMLCPSSACAPRVTLQSTLRKGCTAWATPAPTSKVE